MNDVRELMRVAEGVAEQYEGYRVEIIDGQILMTPRSDVQSWTIDEIKYAARDAGLKSKRLLSDVQITFGDDVPRCPDVSILEDGATYPYSHEDLLAAMEVVSTPNDANDYEAKLRQYARFGVPLYLVIDPFQARCVLFSRSSGEEYADRSTYAYGEPIPLSLADGTAVTIPTDEFETKD